MRISQIVEKIVIPFPKTVFLIFLVISVYAATLLSDLVTEPSPYLLPPTHESRVNLKNLTKKYTGSKDSILILLEADRNIFNYETLSRIRELTIAFENLNIVTDEDKEGLLKAALNSIDYFNLGTIKKNKK